ncbi:acyl-CoA dehydrogenase family protein [Actinocorallia sp. A-T 12471]|uniref:acyl-CoA dehydrogenase family protein n=1 Tax=Actinocorallia sp. A-T 12471 TaxID=3089813 RepID=UPI0029D1E263|nr:acyl-CoA dehydrogenase family protein [Actinocorallia sp. A-T 12471]MDX6741630.1 acyl-CoA dehydrogenase family protein [Actinocorallia sp. A-T 12471]
MTAVAPPAPGADELLARAEEFVPLLVERQAETEDATMYAADLHERFAEAGLYRVLTPRVFGGLELGAEAFFRVVMTLARGCPSTAWMYTFAHAHALAAATLFGREAQEELFASPDFLCPATVAPAGIATPVPGGWRVSGTFGYCSGSPYATHFMGHTLVVGPDGPPTPLLFVLPRASWRRLDDWGNSLGLRGSGSHSVVVDDAFVPAHHALGLHLSQTAVTEDTPGRLLHAGPEYAGGPLSFMLLQLGALAAGMARGALDAYAELMRVRTTSFPPIVSRAEDPGFQFRYGEAAGMVAAAESAVLGAVRTWHDTCVTGPSAFTREHELSLALTSREAIRLSWRAVESHLFPTAGSSSVRSGERVERVWRDMSTLHSHAGPGTFLSTLAPRELARSHFGLA